MIDSNNKITATTERRTTRSTANKRSSYSSYRKLYNERRHVLSTELDVVYEEKEVEFVGALPKLFPKSINRTQRFDCISSITPRDKKEEEQTILIDNADLLQSKPAGDLSSWGFFME
eukprot:CAMPEP_0194133076 /NCGR_PEP_ID=MMETSP0152-20130528/3382_1 /TAXON_ID=1049557 /ORGANISM="Thalassiothrix antarctica, Strain L6-D1" /LENGTH=116 /DNA_ID=CAMNT_0038828311 /DNA_START=94 /DNA_END=444 /DNA_ORIENTATION=-